MQRLFKRVQRVMLAVLVLFVMVWSTSAAIAVEPPQGGEENQTASQTENETDAQNEPETNEPDTNEPETNEPDTNEPDTGEEDSEDEEIEALELEKLEITLFSAVDPVAVVVSILPNGTAYQEAINTALTDGTGCYDSLEDALDAASSGQTVILLKDYTLTRSVAVKSGVFLLLPCEDTYKAYESNGFNPNGTSTSPSTGMNGELFKTLSIPAGMTLTINGDVLVNAVTGRPSAGHFDMDINGGYAKVNLDGGILVKNGGKLEVCGLVQGEGQVTAESGGTVLDLYIVRHWRGGTQASKMILAIPSVYPMNEIDCHNIQTTLRVNYGASFGGTVKMYATGMFFYTRFPQIDNLNGLIRLNSGGYAIRTYNASTGRSTIELYGGATASRSTLYIVSMDLSTGLFTYPIDGDLTFVLNSGNYVLDESFKFMTGNEIFVRGDATLTVKPGKMSLHYDKFDDVNTYDNWKYPTRPAAVLSLDAGAKLYVNGSFAGRISSTSNGAGVAQVSFGSDAVLQLRSYESNQQYESPVTVPLDFKTLLWNGSEETSHIPTAGKTYNFTGGAWTGGDIPSGTGTGSLSGTVSLQGRSDHSGATVTLQSDGAKYVVHTGAGGEYSFTGVDAGIYSVTVTMPGYLGHTKTNITISSGAVTAGGISLRGGDLDGNGAVNVSDLNVLLGSYQKSGMMPANGDINGNGMVNVDDLNILLGNYQKTAVVE